MLYVCVLFLVTSLKKWCTSVVMSAILDQKSLDSVQLCARLPDYVPTVTRKAIVGALFGCCKHAAWEDGW